MMLPGTSISKQTTDLTTYSVTRNFRGFCGNPWALSFELPSIENVDLSEYTFALLIYNALGQIVLDDRFAYASPAAITLNSPQTEKLLPGVYSYFLIALKGSGNNTTNYTIAMGLMTSIENKTIDGAANITIVFPDPKYDGGK